MIKLGILKETKTPPDHRVPLTPTQCAETLKKFPNVEIFVQPSDIRAFTDDEYTDVGIDLKEDLSDCDILMGVKEVKMDKLIPNKKYLFFSHTAKKQPYNRDLLKTILDKKIQMIDYEYLVDESGKRVVAFGYYAGVVGAYNALLGYGLQSKAYKLKPAHECHDLNECYEELKKIKLPEDYKILLTGRGRVSKGAQNILKKAKANFTVLGSADYVERKDGKPYDRDNFYQHPEEYQNALTPYTKTHDMYIACHFWHHKSPKLIAAEDYKDPEFKLKIIADISCDINGPIASTTRSSTIADPFYDYEGVLVMAVDNLPCELPRDASNEFGDNLIKYVFPNLFNEETETEMIKKASLTKDGQLTELYSYLEDYVNQR